MTEHRFEHQGEQSQAVSLTREVERETIKAAHHGHCPCCGGRWIKLITDTSESKENGVRYEEVKLIVGCPTCGELHFHMRDVISEWIPTL